MTEAVRIGAAWANLVQSMAGGASLLQRFGGARPKVAPVDSWAYR